jgi:hypothetical protein
MGRLEFLGAIATDIGISLIVGKDDHKIGQAGSAGGNGDAA